ncbi:glycosyl hydrolase family 16 [Rhodohalobacter mucosus]|uniref:Glycosyl hydrolase family 16 n=1 Tax=Rhodohalobacter mucosus TaxID=2079485 RepID=A0A316TP98_9BACT|nr:glycosyl hydrolase family 16 [Rhodohalobacter mucosus]PWN06220.1 glycosyl hydrolase family 16 [Rhodohalobacter mucosus]
MKTEKQNGYQKIIFSGLILLLAVWGCERSVSDLEEADFPDNPNVFLDTFSSSLNYAVFEGAVPEAFQVDEEETYDNTIASMRFDVPDFGDPRGSYAGGAFFTSVPRDLTGYNALTFWARGDQSSTIGVMGLGIDLGENRFQASVTDIQVFRNWKKYIIPIPDPEKLVEESGMLFYSSGPIDGEGYTFWVDEVKFENLGTIAFRSASIFNGDDRNVTAQNGQTVNIEGLVSTHGLPDGTDQTVNTSPFYFTFTSSNESVAQVADNGEVTVVGEGQAVITAQFRGSDANGSLTVNSSGEAVEPEDLPPAPTQDPADVISMYTNVYDNVTVDTWNTGWEFSTAQESFIQIQGQDVIRYQNLNFVGIEFASETIDASGMTHFRLDIWTPDPTDLPNEFKVLLVDFGADNVFGGGDDSQHEVTFTSPVLSTESWVTLDIPLSDFSGLQNRENLAQLVLSGDLPNVYVTNVYFYAGETSEPETPEAPAPTPTEDAADVISLFSDAYSDVAVDTWRTDWSSAVLEDIDIQTNATKKYSALDFVGIETTGQNLVDASSMDFMHIDLWTPNMTTVRIKLVDFGANGAFDGGDDSEHEIIFDNLPTSQWNSLKIPMSDFTGLQAQSNLAQYILSGLPAGQGILYVDNVYFSTESAQP